MLSYKILLQRYENLKKQHKKVIEENFKLHYENKNLLKIIEKMKNKNNK